MDYFVSYTEIKLLQLLMFLSITIGVAQTQTKEMSIPVVKRSEIKKISLKAGLYDYALEMTNGKKWDVRILVPEIQKDKVYSMVLAMHWAGGQETFKTYSDCLVFPAFDTMNAVIVVPSSDKVSWTHSTNEKRVIDLVRKLKKHFPIAKQQILITGYSNGAIGTWEYASAYPKLFSAAIPMAGLYEKKHIRIPVYAIHGKKDELFNVYKMQYKMEQSKKMGSQIEVTIAEDFSHYMACSYVDLLRKKAKQVNKTIFEEKANSSNNN